MEEKKDIYIKMMATKDEWERIKNWSDENQISISDMIRLGLNTIGGLDLEYGNKKRQTKKNQT
jgi:hypothetical protein